MSVRSVVSVMQSVKHETLTQCRAIVGRIGPALGQRFSCLLGVLKGHTCVLHITGCEDIKTAAQLIEPKDDLVTVDHLPSSKS